MSLKSSLASVVFVFFSLSATYQAQAGVCSSFLSKTPSYSSRVNQLFSSDQAEDLLNQLVVLKQEGRIRRPSELFEAFLFYRLRLLPAPIANEVMLALQQDFRVRIEPTETARLGGGAMLYESKEDGRKACTVLVCLPEALMGTALDLAVRVAVRVHEIEHVIQHFMGLRARGTWQTFMTEQGAMRAEAVMLYSFSKEDLKALRDLVNRTLLEPDTLDFSLRALDMALEGKRVQDYVKGQWRTGRYSRGSILKLLLSERNWFWER